MRDDIAAVNVIGSTQIWSRLPENKWRILLNITEVWNQNHSLQVTHIYILKVRKYIWQMDLQSPLKREAGVIFLSLPGATSFVSLVLQAGSLSGLPMWTCHLYPHWSSHLSWPALLTRLPLFLVFSFQRYFTPTSSWEFSYCIAIVLAIFAAVPNSCRRKQGHAGSAGDVNSISMSCVLL